MEVTLKPDAKGLAMKATFIGGWLHGEAIDMQDDTRSFKAARPCSVADPLPVAGEDTYQLYVKQTWHNPQKGDAVLMVLHGLSGPEVDKLARPLMEPAIKDVR